MYSLVSKIIQLLLRALNWYEHKVREEELESLAEDRKELEEEMNRAKNSKELADVVSNWSTNKLSASDGSDKSKTEDVDDSSETNSEPNGE